MKVDFETNDLRRKTVGRFLKTKRQEAELTQQDVAKALNYSSPQFVSNWERGVALPPLVALPKIASLYQVAPKEIIEILEKYQEQLFKHQKKVLTQIFKKEGRA